MIDIERPSGFTSERTLASDFEKLLLIPNAFSFLHIPLVLCENVSAANFRELSWNGVRTFGSVAYFMIYTHRHTNVHTRKNTDMNTQTLTQTYRHTNVHTRKNTDMNTQTHTWANHCHHCKKNLPAWAHIGRLGRLFDETGWRFG